MTIYTALVSFEIVDARILELDLPEQAHGAVGYMAVAAADEDDLRNALHAELKQAGLRLIEIDDIAEWPDGDIPEELDDHLAVNVRAWMPGRRAVWGTIRPYYGEGEA